MKKLKPDEEWARRMVSAALGVPVIQLDDGSRPGMPDLAIHYQQGRLAVVEVTAAADQGLVELWNLMNGRGSRWQIASLQGGWAVTVAPQARYQELRAELPMLLALLEEARVSHLRPSGESLNELEEPPAA